MAANDSTNTELMTFTATDRRTIRAHETVKDFGANYLNPLVGRSAAETCSNVEEVVAFLHRIIDSSESIDDFRPGISLILQTVWTAVQYERDAIAD